MNTSDKLPLIKQAFLMLTENLNEGDIISIVTYESDTNVLLDGAASNQVRQMQTAIGNLKAGGSTNGSQGLTMAYNIAKKHFIKGGNNRIIVATDGDLNAGITGESELRSFISDKKKERNISVNYGLRQRECTGRKVRSSLPTAETEITALSTASVKRGAYL